MLGVYKISINQRRQSNFEIVKFHWAKFVDKRSDMFNYRFALKFCGSFILRIGDFLWFAGTNFYGSRWLKFLLGTNFCGSLFK